MGRHAPATACAERLFPGEFIKDWRELVKSYVTAVKCYVDCLAIVAIHLPGTWRLLALVKLLRISRIAGMTQGLYDTAEVAVGGAGPVVVQLMYCVVAMLLV